MQKEWGLAQTWSMAALLSLEMWRQEDNEFKANLVLVVNSKVAKAT